MESIALANKILIPGIAARKFPAVDVIYSDGRKSKLPTVFDASGVDDSKLAVPEASLVCLSFRANSQRHISNSMAMEGALAPTGHVYTFDFHEQKAASAR
ncbi:tRNA (adenine(58)-N(1))-methyltransferase catalytic subunit TRMT61A [Gossypium arboreum]|uniref:tRNA (Adenine(58)-N(1))-methyltransferase catalytic subunit TRMT61A n=1 Tax=Gossypium arboreum TaxID=29729 RepID=A0A0B0NCE3_GOSAR|nr:tRNA (adenine(58)-N(1))-methyltransferase catalytic subunit TRMT61A [Gossypium arboreum]